MNPKYVNNTDENQQYHAKWQEKKLYRQFLKNRETKLCNEKKTMAAKQKRRNYDEKKRIRKPTKTISVHTQKMANTNLKKKPLDIIKDGVISEGNFNLLPSSNKWTKSLSLNFST